jgi:RNA polymerase sigma-70 factor (ECF subfamily)
VRNRTRQGERRFDGFLEAAHDERSPGGSQAICGPFQRPQSGAADIVHAGEVQDHVLSQGLGCRVENPLKVPGGPFGNAPFGRDGRDAVRLRLFHAQIPDNVVFSRHRPNVANLTNFPGGAVYFTNESDTALIERCLSGETTAFETLVSRYQRGLFNVALRMLGSYEDARDSTQNAFVKAYEHLDTFDVSQPFFSWIYRILKNDCLNTLRARRPSEPVSLEWPSESRASDAVESSQRQHAVQSALLALTPEYREVVVLRHFTDLSYEDIAATLGIPVKTVKSRLYTARQRLGALLAEWQ